MDDQSETRFLTTLLFYIALLAAVIYFTSCTTTGSPFPGAIPFEATNRASMPFEVGGQKYIGTAVAQRMSSQNILFTLPKDTIKLMITTCNREEFFAFPPSDKPFAFNYVPVMYLENLDSCLLMATAITRTGEAYKAIIDFRSGEDLPAVMKCNGKAINVIGAALCQARAGLIQAMEFDQEVIGVSQDGCPELEDFFGPYGMQYVAGKGLCAYAFEDKAGRKLRLTVYGYTEIEEVKVK